MISYIAGAYRLGGSFTELLHETALRHPCSPERPWHTILYADEFVAQNPLAVKQTRKAWALYLSFKEFGAEALSNELAWLVVLIKRSDAAKKLSAGVSQLAAKILKFIFCNSNFDPRRAGILVKSSSGETMRIWFEHGFFLQDGGAHKLIYGIKGDSGSKYCLCCKNDFSAQAAEDSNSESEDEGPSLVFTKRSQLALSSDEEVKESCKRLAARKLTCSPQDFKRWEQATGLNYQPEGLLFQEELEDIVNPVSQFMHDWQHGMCSNGCMDKCVYLLFSELVAAGFPAWAHFRDYAAVWQVPGPLSQMKRLMDLFEDGKIKAMKKAKKFRCMASDILALSPIIASWVQHGPMKRGFCNIACAAFVAMAELLDVLASCNSGRITPEILLAAVEAALAACKAAGWDRRLGKKLHWLLHLSDHLKRHGCLIACWTCERKHKILIAIGKYVRNTTTFERSVLEEALCWQLVKLQEPGQFDRAEKLAGSPSAPPKELRELLASIYELRPDDECLQSHTFKMEPAGYVRRGDVALLANASAYDAGEVWMHFKVGACHVSIVSLWQFVTYCPATKLATWRMQESPCIVSSSELLCSLTYCRVNGEATAVIPAVHRR